MQALSCGLHSIIGTSSDTVPATSADVNALSPPWGPALSAAQSAGELIYLSTCMHADLNACACFAFLLENVIFTF